MALASGAPRASDASDTSDTPEGEEATDAREPMSRSDASGRRASTADARRRASVEPAAGSLPRASAADSRQSVFGAAEYREEASWLRGGMIDSMLAGSPNAVSFSEVRAGGSGKRVLGGWFRLVENWIGCLLRHPDHPAGWLVGQGPPSSVFFVCLVGPSPHHLGLVCVGASSSEHPRPGVSRSHARKSE